LLRFTKAGGTVVWKKPIKFAARPVGRKKRGKKTQKERAHCRANGQKTKQPRKT